MSAARLLAVNRGGRCFVLGGSQSLLSVKLFFCYLARRWPWRCLACRALLIGSV